MLGDVDERSPADPRSDYAIAHYATEQILRRSAEQFDAAAAFRPCAVFGVPPSFESFRRWSLIPFSFPRAAAAEGEIVLKSTGEQRRNLVAASDIGETVARWLHRPAADAFEVFNPVGLHSLSVWEFAQLCAAQSRELLGRETRLTRVPPGPKPSPGANFDYGTIHEFCRGSADLRAYVARAITALRQPAESNAL
jgi:UDP-glucose 4-epimerase